MLMLWFEMEKLGLDKVVFANGGVTTPVQWMEFIKNKRNVVHIVGNEKEIEMIAWLNSFGFNYAFAHFCAFPPSWGRNTVEVGRMSLKYWFDMDVIDVVLGQVPAFNQIAIDYTKKVGMIEVGTVPGIKYKKDGTITGSYFCYLTREVFQNG
jgi:hypothetical protein